MAKDHDYDDNETIKFIIEIGGREAGQIADVLTKVALELGVTLKEETKNDKYPTMPLRLAGVKGKIPHFEELMEAIERKADVADGTDKLKEIVAMDNVTVRTKVNRKKEDEQSGRSFGDTVESLYD